MHHPDLSKKMKLRIVHFLIFKWPCKYFLKDAKSLDMLMALPSRRARSFMLSGGSGSIPRSSFISSGNLAGWAVSRQMASLESPVFCW
jgi:hypothetical protein